MQAGKIAGSFADSGDNFGGAYLMPRGKRYVILQEVQKLMKFILKLIDFILKLMSLVLTMMDHSG